MDVVSIGGNNVSLGISPCPHFFIIDFIGRGRWDGTVDRRWAILSWIHGSTWMCAFAQISGRFPRKDYRSGARVALRYYGKGRRRRSDEFPHQKNQECEILGRLIKHLDESNLWSRMFLHFFSFTNANSFRIYWRRLYLVDYGISGHVTHARLERKLPNHSECNKHSSCNLAKIGIYFQCKKKTQLYINVFGRY